MAGKENIRKEFGPEDRNLAPFLFRDDQAGVGRADIWMTPELKEAAKALQKPWSFSHDEQMTSLDIRDVSLKYSSHEKRSVFFERLINLAKLVNPNFPSTYPLSKPHASESSNTVDGAWLNFWYKYFLPDAFDTVMQDVAGTELNIIPAQPDVLAQAKAYLNAYTSGFIRMDLVADENAEKGEVDSLTDSLREAQIRLVKFLQLLFQCMSDPEVHRVIIQGENQIEVNGAQKEFSGAALKALLTLAYLSDQSEFKLEDFAKLFHGKDSGDAKTDFDNAMKALKKILKLISVHTPAKNHRKISGVKFLVCIDKALISKRLASLNNQ